MIKCTHLPSGILKRGVFVVSFFLLQVSILFGQNAANPTISKTYVYKKTPRVAVHVNGIQSQITAGNVLQSVSYFDFFGRPIQSIAVGMTPNKKDVISLNYYDNLERSTRQYLSYPSTVNNGSFRTNYFSEQASYYSNNYSETVPYSEVVLEDEPRGRVLEQAGIGSNYSLASNHTTKYVYRTNTSGDQVFNWEITDQNKLKLKKLKDSPYWADDVLNVVQVKDPNWESPDGDNGTSLTFTDWQGRTILSRVVSAGERLDTYYVYDEYGQLRYIISPEAINEVKNGNASTIDDNKIFRTSRDFPGNLARNTAYYYMPGVEITLGPTMEFTDGFSLEPYPIDDEFLAKWIFINEYDDHNRLITKKVPGAEAVHYVYDKSGRLILSQDGNQRKANKWTFTKYDARNRPILTGEMTDPRSRDALATYVAGEVVPIGNKYYESRGSGVHGYTNDVWPRISNENSYYVVTYYDNYDFASSWNSDYQFKANYQSFDTPKADKPYGAETGGKIRVLGSNQWLKSVKYYDREGQLIQSVAEHHLNGVEKAYFKYNFVGEITASRSETRLSTGKVVSQHERYEYDHTGRVNKTYHSIDDEPEVLVASVNYNEKGELIEEYWHSTNNGASFIQSLDYSFDVQGRLTKLNDAQRTVEPTDQFGMQLYYDNSPVGFNFSPQYNGNLAGIAWSNGAMGSVDQRAYAYSYSDINQLKGATYKEEDGNNNWNLKVGHFNVSDIAYDGNGNIQTLKRNHSVNNAAVLIDDLEYTYDGNQLVKVRDKSTSSSKDMGFKDGANSNVEYTYDDNGNLLSDANKLITSITYNELNKPVQINFTSNDYIRYTYDAGGLRLKQEVFVAGQLSQSYDYVGGMVFDNGMLSEIQSAQGRLKVDKVASDYNYDYQYFLNDHLGNVRAMVAQEEVAYVATMESGRSQQEAAQFLYVNETRSTARAYTGSASAMLNATQQVNGTARIVGPSKAIHVYQGDVVNTNVQAYSNNTNGVNTITAGQLVFSAIAAAYGVSGTGENTIAHNALQGQLGAATLLSQSPGAVPKAGINYLFFDKDYNYVRGGFDLLTAKQTWQNLAMQFTADREGYLYIYTSNESNLNVNVYFDNLTIAHDSHASVLQADDYYPFGLPMENNGFVKTGNESQKNRFLYQGKEWQTELGLNLYDFHARQFDPALGRFLAVDAASQFSSPYLGMGNMPIMGIDPDGNIFFIIPKISFKGGLSIGLEVGVGLPGVLSASVTGGVGPNGGYWSVQGYAGGVYAGYGSNGFFAGYGYQWNGFSVGYDFTSKTINAGYGIGGSGVSTFGGSAGLNYNLRTRRLGYDLAASYTHIFEKPMETLLEPQIENQNASQNGVKQRESHDCLLGACEYASDYTYEEIEEIFGESYTPGKGSKTKEALIKLYGEKAPYGYTNVIQGEKLYPEVVRNTFAEGGTVFIAKDRNHAIVLTKLEHIKLTYKYRRKNEVEKWKMTYMNPNGGKFGHRWFKQTYNAPVFSVRNTNFMYQIRAIVKAMKF